MLLGELITVEGTGRFCHFLHSGEADEVSIHVVKRLRIQTQARSPENYDFWVQAHITKSYSMVVTD